jgi:excisionase family DNA binding protein
MTSHAAIATALRAQAQALLVTADAIESDAPAEADPIVDVVTHADAMPRRTVLCACRAGALRATKRGRRWLARRSDVDAWLTATAQPDAANDAETSPGAYLRRWAGGR